MRELEVEGGYVCSFAEVGNDLLVWPGRVCG